MKLPKDLLLCLFVLSLSACNDSTQQSGEQVKQTFSVEVDISGSTGKLEIQTAEGTIHSFSANGLYSVNTGVSPGYRYALSLILEPDNQVCALNKSSGTVYSNDILVSVVCIPEVENVRGADIGAATIEQISINLDQFPIERLEDHVFNGSPLIRRHGAAFLSISSYAILHLEHNSQKVYYGVTRSGVPARLFRFNPEIGEVDLSIPIPGASGGWSIKQYGDTLLIGTFSSAQVYQFDLDTEEMHLVFSLEDSGESAIWDMALKGKNLFIATSPSPKVFKYNLESNTLTDLNIQPKHPDNRFVRSLAVSDQKLFAGLGARAELLAYDFATDNWQDVELPMNNDSFVYQLSLAGDKLFMGMRPSTDVYVFDTGTNSYISSLTDLENAPVSDLSTSIESLKVEMLRYLVEFDQITNAISRVSRGSGVDIHITRDETIAGFDVNGIYFEEFFSGVKKIEIDLLSSGIEGSPAYPDSILADNGRVFVGGARLRIYEPSSGRDSYHNVIGEPKAMSLLNGDLLTANYIQAKVWQFPQYMLLGVNGYDFTNQSYLVLDIGHDQHRPKSMISNAATGDVYIGTEPNPGLRGGALTKYNVYTGSASVYKNIVPNHTVYSLAQDQSESDIIYIGTSAKGGSGTDTLDEDTRLVKWDTRAGVPLFNVITKEGSKPITKIIHLSQTSSTLTLKKGDVTSTDSNTGISIRTDNHPWYVRGLVKTADGHLYAIDKSSVFIVDPRSLEFRVLASGFSDLHQLVADSKSGRVYFMHGMDLYSLH